VIEHSIGEACAQRRDGALGARARCPAPRGRGDRGDDETREQGEGGRPPHESDEDDSTDRDGGRRHERQHHAQRQVLQIVDVVDEGAQHRPAARARQPVGSERDEPAHQIGAGHGELAQGRVVAREAVGVAERGAAERERAHPDDSRRQVHDGRLLTRAHDEPRAAGEQSHGGCLGQEPRRGPRPEPSQRRHRAAQDVGRGRHETTSTVRAARVTT